MTKKLSLVFIVVTMVMSTKGNSKTLENVAKDLAQKIGAQAKQNLGDSTTFNIAVLPFGDADHDEKTTFELGNNGTFLQGALSQALVAEAKGTFVVTMPHALPGLFKRAGLSSLNLDFSDAKASAGILKTVGLDAIVGGTIQTKLSSDDKEADVKAQVLLKTGDVVSIDDSLFRDQLGQHSVTTTNTDNDQTFSGRLKVEFIDDQGKALEMKSCCKDGSEFKDTFNHVLFLTLPAEAKGKQYKLRLTNTGAGLIKGLKARTDEWEKRRLFSAAVFVDGVNTFLNAQGQPEYRLPRNSSKWVLSGPQHWVKPPRNAEEGYYLTDARDGVGNSVSTIPGFQKNRETAQAFTLTDAHESIAQSLPSGATELGVISVYFYAQKFDGESEFKVDGPMAGAVGGTKAGNEVQNQIFAVRFPIHNNPVEAWKIVYRFEDAPSDQTRVPVTTDLVSIDDQVSIDSVLPPPNPGRVRR